MTSFAPASLPHRTEASSGFTLLELIISLTITAMVVVVVYSAFSLGVRVWERQGQESDAVKRDEIMFRLLDRDVADMAPYVMLLDGASLSLTAGGPTAFFYVTRNGFGALRRQDRALFFTCLFVAEDDDKDLALYLYKVPTFPGSRSRSPEFRGHACFHALQLCAAGHDPRGRGAHSRRLHESFIFLFLGGI